MSGSKNSTTTTTTITNGKGFFKEIKGKNPSEKRKLLNENGVVLNAYQLEKAKAETSRFRR